MDEQPIELVNNNYFNLHLKKSANYFVVLN